MNSVSDYTRGWAKYKLEILRSMYLCIRGQDGPITSCTFNSDASKLATASRDASVFIWDIRGCFLDPSSPVPVQKLHACHADWITDCRWSNIGDFLVTGSLDFNLKVWDVKTGQEKFKLTGHMTSITAIGFSYGCIVSTSSDGTVKVWSQKGTEITTLHGHTQCANDCALLVSVSESSVVDEEEDFSDWSALPAEEKVVKKKRKIDMEDVLVASCSDDGTIRLWNPLQANELASLTGHDDRVLSVASDSHGNLCTSSLDKSVRLWKPTLSSETVSSCHDAQVTFTAFSKDGSCLLTGSRDGYIKLWCVNTDHTNVDLVQSLKAHTKSVNAGCFVVQDSRKFVTGGDDAVVSEWKWQGAARISKTKSYTMKSPVTSVLWHDKATASSGHVVICAEWDRATVTIINTDQSSPLKSKALGSVDSGMWVMNLLISGEQLTVLTSDSQVQTLRVTGSFTPKGSCEINMSTKCRIQCMADIAQDAPEHKRGLNMILCGTVLEKDIKLAGVRDRARLLGDSKGQLTVLFGGAQAASLKIHDGDVTCVKVIDGLVLTASLDRSVKAWKIDDNGSYTTLKEVLTDGLKQVGQFLCPAPVTCMEILDSSSGMELVCGDQLGNVNFFKVLDLKQIHDGLSM